MVQFIGSHASLDISRLTFRGDYLYAWNTSTNTFAGGTAGGVLMWSFANPWNVTGSTMIVTDSTFRVGGAFAYNLDRSHVFVLDNRFELSDDTSAVVVSDARDSAVMVARNEIVAVGTVSSGFLAWPGNLGTGLTRTRLFIANNTFSGDAAVTFEAGSFHDVSCLAVNNDVTNTTTPYAWDNASTPCRVIERHPKR